MLSSDMINLPWLLGAVIIPQLLALAIGAVSAAQGPEALAARRYFYVGGQYAKVMSHRTNSCRHLSSHLNDLAGWHWHARNERSDVRRGTGSLGWSNAEVSYCLCSWGGPDWHSKFHGILNS